MLLGCWFGELASQTDTRPVRATAWALRHARGTKGKGAARQVAWCSRVPG